MNNNILETAELAAKEAGNLLRKMWENPRELTHKGFRDIVTDADYASQDLITELIRRRHPSHGFLTEESDETLPTEGDVIWIIDPVDGTSNYSRQIPNFTISIAVATPVPGTPHLLETQVGVVYDPLRQDLFSAVRGQGTNLNHRPCFTSQIDDPIHSLFALDWAKDEIERQETLNIMGVVTHQVKSVRALGSAALALSWLAAGRIDGYMSISLYTWDFAAASLLVQEAGGQFTDFHGDPRPYIPWNSNQVDIVASNGTLHSDIIEFIRRGQAIPIPAREL